MTVTLDLPGDVQAKIEAEAARRSVPVTELLERLVADAMTPIEERERRERSIALLRSVGDIGDEAEQRETYEYLKQAVDEDRLSDRKRFT